jgi:MFS family permease
VREQGDTGHPADGADVSASHGALVDDTAPSKTKYSTLAVVVLLVGEFLSIFDISVVNVILPVLQTDLHSESPQAYLVVACYGMAYASLLVMGGRLGDRHGFRIVFLGGIGVFGLASVACGFAPTIEALIVARTVQGLGSALLFPQVLSGIQQIVPPTRRGVAVGAFGAVLGLGSTLGQLGGGVLTELNLASVGWRMAFLVNVPICLAILAVGRWLLPRGTATKRQSDLLGALLLAATLAALVLPWSMRSGTLKLLGTTLVALIVLTLGVAFILWERRLTRSGGEPLLDTSLVHQRGFSVGLVLCLAFFGTQVPFYVVLAQTAQRGAGLDPLSSAELYAGLGVAFLVASVLAGRLNVRRGVLLTTSGPLLMAISYLGLQSLPLSAVHPASVPATALLVLNGFGAGLVAPTVIRFVLSGILPSLSGVASGLLATAQQVANSVGVVAAGAVFEFKQRGSDVLSGFHAALLYFTALAGVTIVLSAVVARTRSLPPTRYSVG